MRINIERNSLFEENLKTVIRIYFVNSYHYNFNYEIKPDFQYINQLIVVEYKNKPRYLKFKW